jgi:hypothetical protein
VQVVSLSKLPPPVYTYDDLKNAIQRAPVSLVVITLDTCGRTFGVAPCSATGEKCYNTFPTCKDRVNYDRQEKEYLYTDVDAPLPFPGPRPYVSKIRYTPTEIKATLAVKGRVTLDMMDEPETTDIGLDPYTADRSVIPDGTYWRKLLARNPNHADRKVEIYEGFIGLTRDAFILRWAGLVESIKTSRGRATVTLVDPLKGVEDIQVPPEIDVKLVVDISASASAVTLSGDTDLMPDAGVVRIEDEFISYAAINRSSNVISGLTRGWQGSTAAEHSANDAVALALYIAPINPFDLVEALLLNGSDMRTYAIPGAGIAAAGVDSAAFAAYKAWPGGEPDFEALIEEPTDLDQLVFELLDIIDCSIWYSEGQKITIRRNIPNEPGRTIRDLTDAANIVDKGAGNASNDEKRYTRVSLFWEHRVLQDVEKRRSYRRQDIAVDADAESASEYGKKREKGIIGRFLSTANQQEEIVQGYAEAVVKRRLLRVRDANPLLQVTVELKDSDILTGDVVAVSTDEILDPSGAPVTRAWGTVVKRTPQKNTVLLTVEIYRGPRMAFIAPDDAPDYDDATLEQRDYCYIADDQGRIDDGPGYGIY